MDNPKLGRYIDPLTDFGFKYLFSNEPHKDLLISFLNSVFQGRKIIKDLKLGATEQIADFSKHRGVTVDLYCTGKDGERFIIEMQRGSQEYFKDRSIYYTSRVINRLVGKKRKWNYELPEVYFIGIMDFRFNDNPDRNYFHDIHLTDRTSGQEFYEKLGYIYIELPNFDKEFTTSDPVEEISELDKCVYVLKHLSHLNKAPGFLNKLIFKKLFKIAEIVNLKNEELMSYESSRKAQWDYDNSIAYAEKKATERGMERGIEKANAAVVKNMIQKSGLSNEQISEIVEISIEYVQKIREELGRQD